MAIRTTAADGRWSQTVNWTGGIKPVSGDIVVVNHNIQIDESIGTDGAGIRNIVVNATGKTLSILPGLSSPITIRFAGTGANPLSASGGTTANPFGTDLGESATMFGFFATRGHLNLESADPSLVTIQGGDDASPVFFRHGWGDVYWNGSAWVAGYIDTALMRLVGVTIKNLGSTTSGYTGVCHRSGSATGSRAHIENCAVLEHQNLLKMLAPSNGATVKGNTLKRSKGFGVDLSSFVATNALIEGNTDTDTIATTDNVFVNSLSVCTGLTIKSNFVTGTSTTCRNLAYLYSGTTGVIIDDNTCINPPRHTATYGAVYDTVRAQGMPTKGDLLMRRNIFVESHTLRVGNGVFEDNHLYDSGEYIPGVHGGIYYVAEAADGIDLRRNTIILKRLHPSKTQFGFFLYSSTTGVRVKNALMEKNTFVCQDPATATVNDAAIRIGQAGGDGDPVQYAISRDNIVVGWGRGMNDDGAISPVVLADGATGVGNWYKRDSGVELALNCGVHHNLFYNISNAGWFMVNPAASAVNGFTNGTDVHPNAIYGDLTSDPLFKNPSGTTRDDYMLLAGSPAIGAASDGGNMGAMGVYTAPSPEPAPSTRSRAYKVTATLISPSKVTAIPTTPFN